MSDGLMGEVFREGATVGARFQRVWLHDPVKLFRALTESGALRHWWPADIVGQLGDGTDIELVFWPEQVKKYGISQANLKGRVRRYDPPQLFEYTWEMDILRFEVEPVGGGSRLTFTTWFGDDDPSGIQSAMAGYHVCLDALDQVLSYGKAAPLIDRSVDRLRELYRPIVRG